MNNLEIVPVVQEIKKTREARINHEIVRHLILASQVEIVRPQTQAETQALELEAEMDHHGQTLRQMQGQEQLVPVEAEAVHQANFHVPCAVKDILS